MSKSSLHCKKRCHLPSSSLTLFFFVFFYFNKNVFTAVICTQFVVVTWDTYFGKKKKNLFCKIFCKKCPTVKGLKCLIGGKREKQIKWSAWLNSKRLRLFSWVLRRYHFSSTGLSFSGFFFLFFFSANFECISFQYVNLNCGNSALPVMGQFQVTAAGWRWGPEPAVQQQQPVWPLNSWEWTSSSNLQMVRDD